MSRFPINSNKMSIKLFKIILLLLYSYHISEVTAIKGNNLAYLSNCSDTCIGKHQVCLDEKCQCDLDYIWNITINDCQMTWNSSLFFRSGPTFEEPCSNQAHNVNCDTGQRCVDNLCQCKPNYKWNSDKQKCEHFKCTKFNSQLCRGNYDKYRECVNEYCICLQYYEPNVTNGDKCTFSGQITTTPPNKNVIKKGSSNKKYLYIGVGVVITVLFVVNLVGYSRHRSKQQRINLDQPSL